MSNESSLSRLLQTEEDARERVDTAGAQAQQIVDQAQEETLEEQERENIVHAKKIKALHESEEEPDD